MTAVDLDHEPAIGPVEVDLEAVEPGIDERLGQAHAEEGILGAAARPGAARPVELDRSSRTARLWRPFARAMTSRTAASTKRPGTRLRG